MHTPKAPQGYNTVNPFIITKDATTIIAFIKQVFNATETEEAFTTDTDGLVLHCELRIGDSVILLGESKPDWAFTPGFMQVYVDDVEATLKQAEKLGAKVITKPTDFYGDLLSCVQDPAGNIWWIYQHVGEPTWDAGDATDGDADAAAWDAEPSKELKYIHSTLMDAMQHLGK